MKVARHVDSSSCTQEYLCAARRGELLSSGRHESNTRSIGFAPQAVGQALLAHGCGRSRINQDLVIENIHFVGSAFVLL